MNQSKVRLLGCDGLEELDWAAFDVPDDEEDTLIEDYHGLASKGPQVDGKCRQAESSASDD